MKQKKKLFALLLAICVMVAGTSAFAADTAIVMRSTAPNGSAVPYTLYVVSTTTNFRSTGAGAATYTLNMSMTRSVSKAYCWVNVQKYLGDGVWETQSTRYYEQYNCDELDVVDSISGYPSGQYRVVVDYYATLNGYTDYVQSASRSIYL